jgi:ketosteroid isomerase-like protein
MPTDPALTDRAEITDLFARLTRLLDEARYNDAATIYTPDITVYSPRGGELHGINNVIDYLHKTHVEDVHTQHMHSDLLINLNGDQAHATANQLVHFYRPDQPPHQTSGLNVTYKATRTPTGWRFHQARIALAWTQKN